MLMGIFTFIAFYNLPFASASLLVLGIVLLTNNDGDED
jgi:hypothetical protein